MRICLFAVAAILTTSWISAHADTVYQLENQLGTASVGTVSINATAGTVSGLSTVQMVNGIAVTFAGPATSQSYNAALNEYQAIFLVAGDEFQFNLPNEPSLVSFAPADNSFCSLLSFTCDYLANVYQGVPSLANGPLTTFEGNLLAQSATSVTPEPSAIVLLGTGLLGLAGAARRRLKW